MGAESIAADVGAVLDELRPLAQSQQQLPSPAKVREVRGASHGVANEFSMELQYAMTTASTKLEQIAAELNYLQEAVRGALEDLAANDEESRAALQAYDTEIESARNPASTHYTPAPGPATQSRWLA